MTEWNASEYDRTSALQATIAEEVLSLLNLKGTEHILDIGCGDGKTTASIAARVPNGAVIGVDASSDMIAFAKEHWLPAHPNLQFAVADARRLPFQQEFDLIVSLNTLHWISDQVSVLQSIRATLKPDGRAQLRFVSKGPRKSVQDVVEETRRSPRWADYFNGFRDPLSHVTPEQYAALAEQQGFRVVSIRTSDKAWDFGSRDAFLARMNVTLVEWTQHVPEPDRVAFIIDALDRYRNVAVTAPGEENYFRFYQMDIVLALQ
ncbi:MAG: class I SAM-dependent methyltransferase [Acidobacteriaceae bacterium]